MQIDLNQVLCTKEQVTLEDLIRKFTGIDYLDEELNTQNNVVTKTHSSWWCTCEFTWIFAKNKPKFEYPSGYFDGLMVWRIIWGLFVFPFSLDSDSKSFNKTSIFFTRLINFCTPFNSKFLNTSYADTPINCLGLIRKIKRRGNRACSCICWENRELW